VILFHLHSESRDTPFTPPEVNFADTHLARLIRASGGQNGELQSQVDGVFIGFERVHDSGHVIIVCRRVVVFLANLLIHQHGQMAFPARGVFAGAQPLRPRRIKHALYAPAKLPRCFVFDGP
jgi:hypothetical protein